MPYYERVERRRGYQQNSRGVLGFWVPLILTVSVATAGIAAWVWSERHDDEDEEGDEGGAGSAQGPFAPPGLGGPSRPPQYGGPGEVPFPPDLSRDEGVVSRMSGALARTPSPQQMLDSASRTVVAGVSAAGAAVGGALASIREEDKDEYRDHSRWSEEVRSRETAAASAALGAKIASKAAASTGGPDGRRRRTVAIVVSADTIGASEHDGEAYLDHESILSHLPKSINSGDTRLFVLIYAPDLKQHPLSPSAKQQGNSSVTSSYSNIGHDETGSPGEEREEGEKPLTTVDPAPATDSPSPPPSYRALQAQAQSRVENESMILPFTTPTGHVHLLRHLAPEIVYVQESLAGVDGEAATHLTGWVGQIIVVVGADGGHGGLIDSEDEAAHGGSDAQTSGGRWWQRSEKVGLGKGIDIVDSMRVGEDWAKRVGGLV